MRTRSLRQDITHWAATPNSSGGYTYSQPVLLRGRWEDRAELVPSPTGGDVMSRATVFLNSDVAVEDAIALGDHTDVSDPALLAEASRVMQFFKTPSLRMVDWERKAFV